MQAGEGGTVRKYARLAQMTLPFLSIPAANTAGSEGINIPTE